MIYLDFETRSSLDLKAVGAWRYVCEPRTEIICLGWAIDGRPAELWTPGRPFPARLAAGLAIGGPVEAHNSGFERHIWQAIGVRRHGFPAIADGRWRCSMSKAAARGLPQSLEGLAKALGLDLAKDVEGFRSMRRAALPLRQTQTGGLFDESGIVFDDRPALLERVYLYCLNDVEVERAASVVLPDLGPRELEIWRLDQAINDRGIRIDVDLCSNAIAIVENYSRKLALELFDVTGGAVCLPTEIERIKKWLRSVGVHVVTLDDSAVAKLLADPYLAAKPRRALEIRQTAGRSSIAKFHEMLSARDPADDRIRDSFRYHGAFTGRWAGKGVQLQNLPRGTIAQADDLGNLFAAGDFDDIELLFGDPIEAAVSALRPALIPADGCRFLVWDFAQIEARVLAWLAGCSSLLDAFRSGADVYKVFAARAFGKRIELVTKRERFIGKTCVLGLGYGMGSSRLDFTFASAGIEVGDQTAKMLVDRYRSTFPEIPALWRRVEDNAKRAIEGKKSIGLRFGHFCKAGRFMEFWLPAGRPIAYLDARLDGDRIVYKKPLGKGLARAETYGGKLVENIVQAIARDIMAEGMLALDRSGFAIVGTIHDEVIAEGPTTSAVDRLTIGKSILEAVPQWCSVPLAVEGFTCARYRK